MKEIRGIIPAMATPVNASGDVDPGKVPQLVERLLENGADGIFVCGSMGEAASFSADERLRLFDKVLECVNGRVPVLGGTGMVSTYETMALTKAVSGMGLAAVSVITPFYWKLSQDNLFAHYARVIDVSDTPVFAYNLPNNTGLNLEPETVGRLYRECGLKGAKDSSGVWENTKGYLDCTGPDFTLLTGSDALCAKGALYGSSGAISAQSNVCTYVLKAVFTRAKAGDAEGAEEAQRDWNEIVRLIATCGMFPGDVKTAVNHLTAPVGDPRLPVLPGDETLFAKVADQILAIAAKYR